MKKRKLNYIATARCPRCNCFCSCPKMKLHPFKKEYIFYCPMCRLDFSVWE